MKRDGKSREWHKKVRKARVAAPKWMRSLVGDTVGYIVENQISIIFNLIFKAMGSHFWDFIFYEGYSGCLPWEDWNLNGEGENRKAIIIVYGEMKVAW